MWNLFENNKLMLSSLIIDVCCQTHKGIIQLAWDFAELVIMCSLTFAPCRHLCWPDLCAHPTFVPSDICAQRHLCLPTFVPIAICAHRHLCPPPFVPTAICAHRHLCLLTLVASDTCAHCIISFCDLIILPFVYLLFVVFAVCKKVVFISFSKIVAYSKLFTLFLLLPPNCHPSDQIFADSSFNFQIFTAAPPPPTHTHTHTHTCARTHTRTRMRMYTHTHTRRRAHI